MLPLSLRTQGSAWTAAASWASTFLVVEITPVGIASLDQYFYLLFVGANILMALCVYFFYPETSGLPLEAVDVIFTEEYTTWRGAVKKSLEVRRNNKQGNLPLRDVEAFEKPVKREISH